MRLSDLYNMQIIGTSGKVYGKVEDIILNFENGVVYSVLTEKLENIKREQDIKDRLIKSSIKFERVVSISDNIIINDNQIKR
ncbi:MAG: hypothetical protein ARM1_0184 [Candidatus Micrarchaeota archaeon]|nr:MAG: hypothetical protein ARM1_0184 [Candidatus Micrarchaeota archaeon]